MHCDVFADLLPLDNLLVEHRRGSTLELVIPLLVLALVRCDVVSHERRLLACDDGNVHVTSRSQIVPDTGLDSIGAQLHGVFPGEVALPLCLEHRHGSERARPHGNIGQFVGRAVSVHGKEVGTGGVYAGNDEVGTDVALVPEEMLLEHGHAGDDAGFAAGGEGMQLEVGRYDGGGELCVGGCTGTSTPDVRGDVVQLLAVL